MAGRGGRIPGAGRKKGSVTKKSKEIAEKAFSSGITPLEYILNILRDEMQSPEKRYEAAVDAAPYMHSKLATTTMKNADGEKFEHEVTISFRDVK